MLAGWLGSKAMSLSLSFVSTGTRPSVPASAMRILLVGIGIAQIQCPTAHMATLGPASSA